MNLTSYNIYLMFKANCSFAVAVGKLTCVVDKREPLTSSISAAYARFGTFAKHYGV